MRPCSAQSIAYRCIALDGFKAIVEIERCFAAAKKQITIGSQHLPYPLQDEATSVVWGMPGIVADAGLAEDAIPLHEIGAAILHRIA